MNNYRFNELSEDTRIRLINRKREEGMNIDHKMAIYNLVKSTEDTLERALGLTLERIYFDEFYTPSYEARCVDRDFLKNMLIQPKEYGGLGLKDNLALDVVIECVYPTSYPSSIPLEFYHLEDFKGFAKSELLKYIDVKDDLYPDEEEMKVYEQRFLGEICAVAVKCDDFIFEFFLKLSKDLKAIAGDVIDEINSDEYISTVLEEEGAIYDVNGNIS